MELSGKILFVVGKFNERFELRLGGNSTSVEVKFWTLTKVGVFRVEYCITGGDAGLRT